MTKSNSFLEELKYIEKDKNREILKKTLQDLKQKAKDIFKLKLETTIWLNQFDLEDCDKKAIIDWINNLPDVKLSEKDKKEIESDIKRKYKERIENFKKNNEIENWRIHNPISIPDMSLQPWNWLLNPDKKEYPSFPYKPIDIWYKIDVNNTNSQSQITLSNWWIL